MRGFISSSVMLATCAFFAPQGVIAQDSENNGKSAGQVTVLPRMSVADNLLSRHLPGTEYSDGEGWWALACPKQCELYSTALSIESKPHPVYDGDDVPGQMLSFAPIPPVAEVLLFFNPSQLGERLRLRAGPVPTYYPGLVPHLHRPSSGGTMEAEIGLQEGRIARLIPTVMLASEDGATSSEDGGSASSPALKLELQMEGQRQVLGTFTFGIEGEFALKPQDYVVWAGDLDDDGKADFLLNFDFSGIGLALFLSSLAREGEIVGMAGSFVYYPIDVSGC